MGVMRRGARGFPCRVTPSHFGLDSRGTDDRLSALVCCFSKRPGADRIASVRVHAVKFVIAWVCQFFLVLCSRSSGLYDSFASFFYSPCSEWFQTFSGKVSDELVWELGQTCAAARNGTIIIFNLIIMVGKI